MTSVKTRKIKGYVVNICAEKRKEKERKVRIYLAAFDLCIGVINAKILGCNTNSLIVSLTIKNHSYLEQFRSRKNRETLIKQSVVTK